ncbi:UNVERIFIED_CONTAM: hypothetical protein K2H54_057109 [Gekko kuhli]
MKKLCLLLPFVTSLLQAPPPLELLAAPAWISSSPVGTAPIQDLLAHQGPGALGECLVHLAGNAWNPEDKAGYNDFFPIGQCSV